MYEKAMEAVEKHLIFTPMTKDSADILASGSLVYHKAQNGKTENPQFIPQNSHLTCFAGGMLAMGAKIFSRPNDLTLAKKLTEGCIWAYKATTTHIMPESYLHIPCPPSESSKPCAPGGKAWREAARKAETKNLPLGMAEIRSRKYILRPEAIESIFYLYRITGDEHWRDEGWEMFQAIEKATKTRFGNSGIEDVMSSEPGKVDVMESFWMAETLKYFWLLFCSEDVVSLDEYVL
jgi:mannosyl-oligosaccharide alpha-1,2-mannosidase